MQDLIIFVVPIILGSGIPLFDRIGKEIRLRTGKVERYESGLVRLHYEVMEGNLKFTVPSKDNYGTHFPQMSIQFLQLLLLSFCLKTAPDIQTCVLKYPTLFYLVPSFKDSASHFSKSQLK